MVISAVRSSKGLGRTVLARVAAAGLMLVASAALVACSEAEAGTTLPVVSGVVLDGPQGSPVTSGEVELIVHPAALGNRAPDAAGESTDVVSLGPSGRFTLEASPDDLTPHVGADGRVQVEVRLVGGAEAGLRTTVLVRRDKETGEASVVETTGVEVHAARAG